MMKLRKSLFLFCCLLAMANAMGSDFSNKVQLTGTVKGGTDVRVRIFKLVDNKVANTLTYYCNNENPDFGCRMPFDENSQYAVSVQVYKLIGNKLKFEKVAQFPLTLKRGGHYEIAVDAEKLDHKTKTGLTVKPATVGKAMFLVSGVTNSSDNAGEYTLSKIVNGEPVALCTYVGSEKQNEFYFAIPKVQEGFLTISGEKWNLRCYAKPNDTLFLNINNHSGKVITATGSPENQILNSWENLLTPVMVDEYHRVGFNNDTIPFDNYLALYKQQTEQVPAFIQSQSTKLANCSPMFNRLFPLLSEADLELFPLWYYQNLLSAREGRKKGFEVKSLPEVPAAFKTFITTNLYKDSNLLEVPEVSRLVCLHSMLLAADSSSRAHSPLQFSDQMAITMAAFENDKVRSLFLVKQLEAPEVFNYTEFRETFAPFSALVNTPAMQAKYDEVKSQFIGDTAYIGKEAYNFMLPDSSGKMVSMKDLAGKVIFIDVWASWCGPCIKEAPYLNALAAEYAGNNQMQFVGISIDKETDNAKWRKAIQHEKLPGIQLIDDGGKNFGRKYRISSIPRFLLIDKNGNWKEIRCPRPSQKELLKKYIDAALAA